MLGKRKATQAITPSKKKRKATSAIEEIAFDFSAREDYLTGFHKRKLQRIKLAKEEAAKKDREEKITARKILREGRKADLEKHVAEVNHLIRKANATSDASEEEYDGQEEQWTGIKENHGPHVDHDDEYMDEDKLTTVTVEAVDVSKDGLRKASQDGESESEASGTENPEIESQQSTALEGSTGPEKGKRVWTKEPPSVPRKRKKKFRYESKAERKATRYKERSGNKAKARARRER